MATTDYRRVRVLRPGGLFFLGVYGALKTGEVDFHVAQDGTQHRFQSLTLRRSLTAGGPASSA